MMSVKVLGVFSILAFLAFFIPSPAYGIIQCYDSLSGVNYDDENKEKTAVTCLKTDYCIFAGALENRKFTGGPRIVLRACGTEKTCPEVREQKGYLEGIINTPVYGSWWCCNQDYCNDNKNSAGNNQKVQGPPSPRLCYENMMSWNPNEAKIMTCGTDYCLFSPSIEVAGGKWEKLQYCGNDACSYEGKHTGDVTIVSGQPYTGTYYCCKTDKCNKDRPFHGSTGVPQPDPPTEPNAIRCYQSITVGGRQEKPREAVTCKKDVEYCVFSNALTQANGDGFGSSVEVRGCSEAGCPKGGEQSGPFEVSEDIQATGSWWCCNKDYCNDNSGSATNDKKVKPRMCYNSVKWDTFSWLNTNGEKEKPCPNTDYCLISDNLKDEKGREVKLRICGESDLCSSEGRYEAKQLGDYKVYGNPVKGTWLCCKADLCNNNKAVAEESGGGSAGTGSGGRAAKGSGGGMRKGGNQWSLYAIILLSVASLLLPILPAPSSL